MGGNGNQGGSSFSGGNAGFGGQGFGGQGFSGQGGPNGGFGGQGGFSGGQGGFNNGNGGGYYGEPPKQSVYNSNPYKGVSDLNHGPDYYNPTDTNSNPQ